MDAACQNVILAVAEIAISSYVAPKSLSDSQPVRSLMFPLKLSSFQILRLVNYNLGNQIQQLRTTMRRKFKNKVRSKSSGKKTKKARKSLPQLLDVRIVDSNSDGDLLAKPLDWNEDRLGKSPTILVLQDQNESWNNQTNDDSILKIRLLGRSKDDDVEYIGKIITISAKSKQSKTRFFFSGN